MKEIKKDQIIQNNQLHKKDTGSDEVQHALLKDKIAQLSIHLKKNIKDIKSRRILLKKVAKEKKIKKRILIKTTKTKKKEVTLNS